MAPPEQISRGCVPSFVFDVFRGDGEWSPTPPYHLQDVEEDPYYPDHPIYSQAFGVHHGRHLLAHDDGAF